MNSERRIRFLVLLIAPLFLVTGCGTVKTEQQYADTLTHAGTFYDLSRGHYAGTVAVSNLLHYGDHGLGTFDGLDGEMILFSGVVYRADASCAVSVVPLSNQTPFAVVTYFEADRMFDVEKMNQKLFARALEMRQRLNGIPYALQIRGMFSSLTIRSVPSQKPPWKPLEETLKADQIKMTLTNVTGVMVGYSYPDHLGVLHPSGYHLHFIDTERKLGGHVLDFSIAQARISIDPSATLQVLLAESQADVTEFKPPPPPAHKK